MSRGKVLIIDDDESLRIACAQALEHSDFSIAIACNGAQGLERAHRESFDVALLDLKMPGMPGMEVLQKLKEESPNVMVIIMTGYASIDSAVEAIKHGAYDYLPKPFTPEALTDLVLRAARVGRKTLEDACVAQELDRKMLSDTLIGDSDAMNRVTRLVQKAAPGNSTVLITGETGVGKEVVARATHRLSDRANKAFVTVDCGTLVESLFESELFGHVKGAFSGAIESTVGKIELAEGGTLFLDEIANISLQMQARLLRVVQEREICRVGSTQKKKVDVRIISATNRELLAAAHEGKFRQDLYYRLNVIHIFVPPLRDRLDDIPALSSYFLRKLSNEKQRPGLSLSAEAIQFLKTHTWPGNVRELVNALEYAVVTCEGNIIGVSDLPYCDEDDMPRADRQSLACAPDSDGGYLAHVERTEIARAIEQFHGNKTRTAEHLGINRKTLREKMRRYGLEDGSS
jgi:DNA-binding NtrC family response regulator